MAEMMTVREDFGDNFFGPQDDLLDDEFLRLSIGRQIMIQVWFVNCFIKGGEEDLIPMDSAQADDLMSSQFTPENDMAASCPIFVDDFHLEYSVVIPHDLERIFIAKVYKFRFEFIF